MDNGKPLLRLFSLTAMTAMATVAGAGPPDPPGTPNVVALQTQNCEGPAMVGWVVHPRRAAFQAQGWMPFGDTGYRIDFHRLGRFREWTVGAAARPLARGRRQLRAAEPERDRPLSRRIRGDPHATGPGDGGRRPAAKRPADPGRQRG
jgi:hypothetical protein